MYNYFILDAGLGSVTLWERNVETTAVTYVGVYGTTEWAMACAPEGAVFVDGTEDEAIEAILAENPTTFTRNQRA